jgi:hypothetical protein
MQTNRQSPIQTPDHCDVPMDIPLHFVRLDGTKGVIYPLGRES